MNVLRGSEHDICPVSLETTVLEGTRDGENVT